MNISYYLKCKDINEIFILINIYEIFVNISKNIWFSVYEVEVYLKGWIE